MIDTFLFCVLFLFTLSACEEKDNGVNDPPENVIDMSTEILNSGFELGDDNWEFIDYATTIDTSNARSGNKSLKLINDFMGEKVPIHMAKQTIEGGFVAGAEYNFKIWVKGDREDYYEANDWFGKVLKNILNESISKRFIQRDEFYEEIGSQLAEIEGDADAAFLKERVSHIKAFETKAQKVLKNPMVRKLLT